MLEDGGVVHHSSLQVILYTSAKINLVLYALVLDYQYYTEYIVSFSSLDLRIGLNSIVLYLGHQTAWKMLPFNFELSDGMETHWRRLPESLWGVGCWLLVAYEMHRRKVYITIS